MSQAVASKRTLKNTIMIWDIDSEAVRRGFSGLGTFPKDPAESVPSRSYASGPGRG